MYPQRSHADTASAAATAVSHRYMCLYILNVLAMRFARGMLELPLNTCLSHTDSVGVSDLPAPSGEED